MLKLINTILLSFCLMSLSPFVSASLITNGSFEELTFADSSTSIGTVFNTDLQAYENKHRVWDVFYALPDWETTHGNGIELQKNVVSRSQNGSHHVQRQNSINTIT